MVLNLMLNIGFLENPPDFLKFLGRFHPLVVHLPIGFLLLAIIAQFATRWPKFNPIKPFLIYLWGLGAIGSFVTVLFGYFLSLSGDYDTDTLFWHKWSGIAVFIFSAAMYYLFNTSLKVNEFIKWAFSILVLALIAFTGHKGGNLTHGQTYLFEYAPNVVRGIAGLQPKVIPRKKVTVLDSADIYLDLIQPMMDSKCISCHNSEKKKGDLLLTSYNNMMLGSENGEVIIPGDSETSELFRRITLPENHDDFMPTEGKRPLTEEEIEIIDFWITTGAPKNGYLTEIDTDKKITQLATKYLGLDKNDILNKVVIAPNKVVIDSLRRSGFIINRLMNDNNFIEANFSLSERNLETKDLDLLLELKEQLIWLNLSNTQTKDLHLEKIGQLENLVKLNLRDNYITDDGLKQLYNLKNLESINLSKTKISEGILEISSKFARLKTIYLWQSNANDTLIKQLQNENKNLKIIYKRASEL
ncbi:c-type cytochrome domain-containing protein [Aurantibacter sp.]|uniref:c-type cytochrome domain-containing protein n=1 Tax=Aurantibacter sp. TaxID=2807103 RepID=UPI003267DF05